MGDRARAPLIRGALAVQGGVIVSMTAVASPLLALLGAVAFGAAVAVALVNALSLLQDSLAGGLRDLALSMFHLTLRAGLALSAVLSGIVADVLQPVRVPLLGTLQPGQTVLLATGSLAVLAAFAMPRTLKTPPADGHGRNLPDHPTLARAEPSQGRCATGPCTSPPTWSAAHGASGSASTRNWPWAAPVGSMTMMPGSDVVGMVVPQAFS